MCKYKVIQEKVNGIITYMEYDIDGFTFKPKMEKKNDSYIRISQVTIFDKNMIDVLVNRKFEHKFERLSKIIMNFLFSEDEDSDEGDFVILLDEVARLKALVEAKYQRFLSVEEYKDYIHKLAFLDAQLRQKLAIMNYQNNLEESISQGRGR